VPMESFFIDHLQRETCLEPDEVLTGVVLPALSPGWRGSYSKSRERTAGDFPIVSAAIGFELADGRMQDVRVVLGGVGLRPVRSHEAEAALTGGAPSEEAASRAADAALAKAQALSHNGFKVALAHALILRGVLRLAGEASR
jgi:xanthine dehydrogenase YagS FAD-binding subunit